jgi:hypothetical protein
MTRTSKITILSFLVLSSFAAVKAYSSILMGVAFATLGAIISMTILTGLSSTVTTTQQGVYPRGGLYGTAQTSGQSVVTPGGNVGRAATVQWIDTRDIDTSTLTPKIKQADVAIKAGIQKIMDAAKSNPSKYPKLSSATSSAATLTATSAVGDVLKVGNGSNQKIVSIKLNTNTNGYIPGGVSYGYDAYGNATGYYGLTPAPPSWGAYQYTSYNEVHFTTNTGGVTPPLVPATASDFAKKLANSSSALSAPANVFSDYYGEIDDYLKSNPGNVSYIGSDDPKQVDTGTPYTLPTPASQAQVSAAISAAQAGNATAAANNAVSVAQANYNANPTPENAQRLADAQAAAAAATARQADFQRKLDNVDPKDVNDSANTALSGLTPNQYDGSYDKPDKKGLLDLLQGFASSSPLTSMVRSFSISTSSGQSSISAGKFYGQDLNFSLTRWEPFLRLCGAALIIIAHGFAVLVVVRGW